MDNCERLELLLVKRGRQAVQQDETLKTHLLECKRCRRLLGNWERIPELLEALPERRPGDQALQQLRAAMSDSAGTTATREPRRSRLSTSLAGAAVMLAVIGLSRHLFDKERPSPHLPAFQKTPEAVYEQPRVNREQQLDGPVAIDSVEMHANKQVSDQRARRLAGGDDIEFRADRAVSANARIGPARPEEEYAASELPESVSHSAIAGYYEAGNEGDADNELGQSFGDRQSDSKDDLVASGSLRSELVAGEREATQSKRKENGKSGQPAQGQSAGATPVSSLEFGFLDQYQSTETLYFQPAEGYWANTHVPGDPEIRLLRARLAAWDRSVVNGQGLEQDVRPVPQPFDAPADNSLSLSLMSDASSVDGATRMRVQVGIRGIEHRRGQRPAMNMSLVVDLPPDADDTTRIAARALLDAVLASKQPGDRFSLVVSGPGGLVVPPDEFRFGTLQLARQAIFNTDAAESTAVPGLEDSLSTAAELVRQTDDPSQPLGSSSILLVSADTLANAELLTGQVHGQARDGITLSVVPLGNRPDSRGVEQLVLAGLGSRRVLETPDKARQLIEAELHAASRAVARAARLSIRLGPGVRLIEVVGSERLDAVHSQRVRDIENSMDRRLSANLGIQADRGEDEDGIQIVIPSIFSGDDATVLVDVLVDRPGDIASVSLRYKDLVFMRNGHLQGQLSLPAGTLDRGAAELSVLKNLFVHHFSEAASQAADALGRGQPDEAAAILANMRDGIRALRHEIPAFRNDSDLLRDEQILEVYIDILATLQAGAHQPEMVDSLRYAAWAKAHRPPKEWKP